jgi:hypothetical protein
MEPVPDGGSQLSMSGDSAALSRSPCGAVGREVPAARQALLLTEDSLDVHDELFSLLLDDAAHPRAGRAGARSRPNREDRSCAEHDRNGRRLRRHAEERHLLAVEEINKSGMLPGITFEAVIEDDGSAKAQAISVCQRFINQYKVAAIIGPTLFTVATAADPIAQMSHVPVVAVSNTAPSGITDIGEYI